MCQRGSCTAPASFHVWFGTPQQHRRLCNEHTDLYRREAEQPVYTTEIVVYVAAPTHRDPLAVIMVHDTDEAGELMTGNEVCDRCGKRAYVSCRTRNGGELHFCSHHYRENEGALVRLTEVIHDCRSLLATQVR